MSPALCLRRRSLRRQSLRRDLVIPAGPAFGDARRLARAAVILALLACT